MEINPGIFKAYDIRGVYGQDFDDEMALRLGMAFAELRKNEIGRREGISIVVASDMRVSSPALKKSLIDGLVASGIKVIDIGLASTPTFYFAVASFGYDGGILVSASHNPKEYNGFKMVRDKALPVSKDSGMYILRDMVMDFVPASSTDKGSVELRGDILKAQIERDLQYADSSKIKPFKVVIDPANSMGAQYFDELFRHLPCEIVRMYWELDGTFPNHEADPLKMENMDDLGRKVVETGADLGIATDGDGDRIFFVDNTGKPLDPGITRAILCKIFLNENPGSKIAYDIRPGRITLDTIEENGGIPIVTRVGHSLIKELAIKEGCVFAGESSGHFFLNMSDGCYEVPVIVTLKILEELSLSGISFSEYIRPYQKYHHSGEINSKVADALEKISQIKEKYSDGRINELDGITIEYDDWWFNVRSSNTEPLLRLNLEAKSEELMQVKRDEVLGIIRT